MNYRHAYHAGNHADVLKHIVLARILEHLKKKEKPFRIVDAHAGIGIYDLRADQATRTGEWEQGVGRFYDADSKPLSLSDQVEQLLEPWRMAISAVNPHYRLEHYPGSPEIARRLMRRSDRLMLNELHPEDFASLQRLYARDRNITLTELDAAIAIKSQLPPPERRGLVLLDPPYERDDELERVLRALRDGFERFATGVFCLWYPVTGDGLSDSLVDRIGEMAIAKTLLLELTIRAVVRDGGLAGSGLVLINPPWTLSEEMRELLPQLRDRLAQTPEVRSRVEWLRQD